MPLTFATEILIYKQKMKRNKQKNKKALSLHQQLLYKDMIIETSLRRQRIIKDAILIAAVIAVIIFIWTQKQTL
jgi:hypothetical protein